MTILKQRITAFLIALLLSGLNNAQADNVLVIGEKAPDIRVNEWIKGKPFSGYQLGKVYLIEFGATWCKPCKATIPHLTKLNKKYADALSVYGFFIRESMISDSHEDNVERVKQYVADMGDNLEYNVGMDDAKGTLYQSWGKAALQNAVPHAFIIDKSGRLAWIGNPNSDVMDAVLDQVINDKYDLKAAADAHREKLEGIVAYDPSKPLLIDGNGGEDTDFMFRSLISKWKHGVARGSGYNLPYIRNLNHIEFTDETDFYKRSVQVIGFLLKDLYFMAYNDRVWPFSSTNIIDPGAATSYGKLWREVILEVSDKQPFGEWRSNTSEYYNYSLIVPKEKANNKFLQSVMRRDLQSWFGYQVNVEEREMPVWHLKARKEASQLLKREPETGYEEKGDTWNITTEILASNIYSSIRKKVVINSTGIDYAIHRDIVNEIGDAQKDRDFHRCNAALNRYGLYLEEGVHKMRVIVVRDPIPVESVHSG